MEADPDHWLAMTAMGVMLANKGRLDEAMETFRRVLEANPDNATVWNDVGAQYLGFGKFEAARDAFMKAHEDPAYKKEAEKLHLLTSPLHGEEVQKLVAQLGAMPRSLYDRYSNILENPKSPVRQVNWQIVEAKITKIAKKGRFEFSLAGKTMKARMDNGYTEVKIAGKKAKTKSVKAGMACTVTYKGRRAREIACK